MGLVHTPVGTATADVADQFSRLLAQLGALHRARMRRLDGSVAVEGRAPDFLAVIPRWSCLSGFIGPLAFVGGRGHRGT